MNTRFGPKKMLQAPLSAIVDGLQRARRAHKRLWAIRTGRLVLGEYSYGYPQIIDSGGDRGTVIIGRYCSIADGVKILTGGLHHPEWVSTFPVRIVFNLPGRFEDGQPYTKGDVVIGSDVWIGENALMLSGIRIGHGAVIGASSVCTKDVPDYAIVGGNPARIIRMRFDDNRIAALLRIAWWEWTREQVVENVSLLCSPDIDEFIRKFDPRLRAQMGLAPLPPSPDVSSI